MNVDTVAKFLHSPLPLRTALNAVVAFGLGVVALSQAPTAMRKALLGSDPNLVQQLVAVVVLCSAATLLTSGVIWAMKAARGWWKAYRVRLRQQEQWNEHRRRLSIIVRDLPQEHLGILSKLQEEPERSVTLKSAGLIYPRTITAALVDAGFIEFVANVDGTQALYRLTADAKPVVRDHFEAMRQREAALRQSRAEDVVKNASTTEVAVLRLFGEPNPADPAHPAHRWLEHDEYMAIEALISAGILTSASAPRGVKAERLIMLTAEGTWAVERELLKEPARRTEIPLRYDQIAASGARGSGAR